MSIELENLTHIYMKGTPFEKKALDNITLRISDGEFVGIIGHTGSGKSTLVQHFNGLLKPTSGKVTVNGIDVTRGDLKELRKHVGIVFQYPEHQLFEETVYKDIAFGMVKMGFDDDRIKRNINWALNLVGLDEDILEKSPFELSGGQKRRVAIAGVLVMEPNILILDEPTAGLDPQGKNEIYGYIQNLHRQIGNTVIIISHNMEDIAKIAHRVIVMNEGRIELDGSVATVFREADRLESIGLTIPQISVFIRKLKKIVPDIREDIFTIEDAKNELFKILKRR